MTATYIQEGDALDFIPATDVPLGTVVVVADTVGITTRTIPAGTLGALAVEGVFEVPRVPGGLIPLGKRLAWDPANSRATTDLAVANGKPLGVAAADSADPALTVRVRLITW